MTLIALSLQNVVFRHNMVNHVFSFAGEKVVAVAKQAPACSWCRACDIEMTLTMT